MQQLVQIFFLVLTVLQEAGNQPYRGKLAVAWVICNRSRKYGLSLSDIVLKKWQFTAWQQDSPTRMNIDRANDHHLAECLRAALGALFRLEDDPTGGAEFYLNPTVVIAQVGKLPDWWDIDGDPASEIVIDDHAFRKHI